MWKLPTGLFSKPAGIRFWARTRRDIRIFFYFSGTITEPPMKTSLIPGLSTSSLHSFPCSKSDSAIPLSVPPYFFNFL
jgi:hypothetical protein